MKDFFGQMNCLLINPAVDPPEHAGLANQEDFGDLIRETSAMMEALVAQSPDEPLQELKIGPFPHRQADKPAKRSLPARGSAD